MVCMVGFVKIHSVLDVRDVDYTCNLSLPIPLPPLAKTRSLKTDAFTYTLTHTHTHTHTHTQDSKLGPAGDDYLDLCLTFVYRREGIVNLDYVNLIAESTAAADR